MITAFGDIGLFSATDNSQQPDLHSIFALLTVMQSDLKYGIAVDFWCLLIFCSPAGGYSALDSGGCFRASL
jgi:hypothetical protein